MRIGENNGVAKVSVGTPENTGAAGRSPEEMKQLQEAEGKKKNKSLSFFAGDLNLGRDKVEEERRKAKEIAGQLVQGVHQREIEEQKEMEYRRAHGKELENSVTEMDKLMTDIVKEIQNLEEGDTSDPEVEKRIQELKDGLKEYQDEKVLEHQKARSEFAVVRGMKIEKLKHHDMIDAVKQGEEIEEASNKNVIGILMEETKDNVEKTFEEEKEEAEEKKEASRLQEDRTLKIRTKVKELREEAEEKSDDYEDLLELEQSQTKIMAESADGTLPDMKKSMEQVIGEIQLSAEDLKGLLVDKEL